MKIFLGSASENGFTLLPGWFTLRTKGSLHKPGAAAQVDQIDPCGNDTAAYQYADHAQTEKRVEDDDDAEDDQQNAEDERDPPVRADHSAQAKSIRRPLDPAHMKCVDNAYDTQRQEPPAGKQNNRNTNGHLECRREYKHQAKKQGNDCADEHPCALTHGITDIEPGNNTADAVNDHHNPQHKRDNRRGFNRSEKTVYSCRDH